MEKCAGSKQQYFFCVNQSCLKANAQFFFLLNQKKMKHKPKQSKVVNTAWKTSRQGRLYYISLFMCQY